MTNTFDPMSIQSFADHAAQQSDRWLLITICTLVIVGLVIIWRWIISDREKDRQRLIEITDRHIASGERMAEVAANTTTALNNNTNALREVIEVTAFFRQRNKS
jgi:hypothetical protein